MQSARPEHVAAESRAARVRLIRGVRSPGSQQGADVRAGSCARCENPPGISGTFHAEQLKGLKAEGAACRRVSALLCGVGSHGE